MEAIAAIAIVVAIVGLLLDNTRGGGSVFFGFGSGDGGDGGWGDGDGGDGGGGDGGGGD